MRVGFYFVWGTTDVRVLEVSKARRARHGELWARARARALSGIAAGLVVFLLPQVSITCFQNSSVVVLVQASTMLNVMNLTELVNVIVLVAIFSAQGVAAAIVPCRNF